MQPAAHPSARRPSGRGELVRRALLHSSRPLPLHAAIMPHGAASRPHRGACVSASARMGIHLGAFVAVAAVVIIAPGPDTVLVTKNAVLHGRRAALGTSLGVNTGLVIWTVAAALGVAAVVRESAVAFSVLKLLGAAYLVWLGVQALLAARRRSALQASGEGGSKAAMSARLGFRQGLLSNLGNPKIAVFFTGLLPQFVSARSPVLGPFLLLGGLFVLMTAVWLCGYALIAVRVSSVLARPSVKAALDGLTGLVLVGLGVRLALEQR
jgi:threonine/homoserine/homoserine lactone efflux protein